MKIEIYDPQGESAQAVRGMHQGDDAAFQAPPPVMLLLGGARTITGAAPPVLRWDDTVAFGDQTLTCVSRFQGAWFGRWACGLLTGASLALGAGVSAWAQASVTPAQPARVGASAAPAARPAPNAALKPAPKTPAAATAPAAPAPEVEANGLTRMQVCQLEVQGRKGDRRAALRACLSRRLKGEKLAGRDCQKQAAVGVRPGAQRARAVARCGGVPQARRSAPKTGEPTKAVPAPQPAAGERPL